MQGALCVTINTTFQCHKAAGLYIEKCVLFSESLYPNLSATSWARPRYFLMPELVSSDIKNVMDFSQFSPRLHFTLSAQINSDLHAIFFIR